jgi:hypothetical protein
LRPYPSEQGSDLFKAASINFGERRLRRGCLVRQRAWLVNQDWRKCRPRAETLNGELEGADLLPLRLSRVEGTGGQVVDRVDGGVYAAAEACLKRCTSNQTGKAIAAVLRA